jgi:aminoacylase
MSNENTAVHKLVEYLRIKTVHPEPDYTSAVKFLSEYAREIGFDSYKEIEVSPGRTVCLMIYNGTEPDKPSILLNSHTDVVPVDQVNLRLKFFPNQNYHLSSSEHNH